MPNYDVETALEDAIVSLLEQFTTTKVVRWDDISEKHLSPSNQITDVIKVLVDSVSEEPGTYNLFAGMRCIVDVAVFASRRRDTARRTVNKQLGIIRSVFADSDIVNQLNAIGDVVVYGYGVISLNTFDASDDKNYGKGITFEIVVYPK